MNPPKFYTYRVAIIKSEAKYNHLIFIDFVKDDQNFIIAINNNKGMVHKVQTIKEAKKEIDKSKSDFILTDISGFGMDSIFISKTMSKSDKAKIFNRYTDAFPSIQKSMFTTPSQPRAGHIFEQDMNTSDYFFFFESLDAPTFACLFAVDVVYNAQGRIMIDEFKSF